MSCLKTVLVLSLLFQSHLFLFSSPFVSSSLVVFLSLLSLVPSSHLSSSLISSHFPFPFFASLLLLFSSCLVSCLNSSHRLVFLLASSWSFIFLSPLCLVSFPHSPPVSSPLILFSFVSSSLALFLSSVSSRVVLLSSCLFNSSLIGSHALLVVCPVSSHLNFSHSLGSSSCLLLVYPLGSSILVAFLPFSSLISSQSLLFAHSPPVHIVLPQFLSFSPHLLISPLSLLSHHNKDKKTRLEEKNQDHESRFLVFASVRDSFSSCLVPSCVSSHLSISSLISSHPILFTHSKKKKKNVLLVSYCLFSCQFLSFSCLLSVSSCLTLSFFISSLMVLSFLFYPHLFSFSFCFFSYPLIFFVSFLSLLVLHLPVSRLL